MRFPFIPRQPNGRFTQRNTWTHFVLHGFFAAGGASRPLSTSCLRLVARSVYATAAYIASSWYHRQVLSLSRQPEVPMAGTHHDNAPSFIAEQLIACPFCRAAVCSKRKTADGFSVGSAASRQARLVAQPLEPALAAGPSSVRMGGESLR